MSRHSRCPKQNECTAGRLAGCGVASYHHCLFGTANSKIAMDLISALLTVTAVDQAPELATMVIRQGYFHQGYTSSGTTSRVQSTARGTEVRQKINAIGQTCMSVGTSCRSITATCTTVNCVVELQWLTNKGQIVQASDGSAKPYFYRLDASLLDEMVGPPMGLERYSYLYTRSYGTECCTGHRHVAAGSYHERTMD